MRRTVVILIALLALSAGAAEVQRVPGGAGPTRMAEPVRAPIRVPDTTSDRIAAARRAAAAADEGASRQTREVRETARQERAVIQATYERDNLGRWHRRGEIVVATDAPGAAEAARALGLREVRRDRLVAAGLTLFTFAAPSEVRTQGAFEALRAARPDDAIDLNYVYAFDALQPAAGGERLPARRANGPRVVAMIDSALPANALAGVKVVTERFGPGAPRPSAHALAVAAVLADTAGREGLAILAADVSEPGPLPGASASSIALALDWAAGGRVTVVNVSLTGPPNAALAAVVRRISARGVVIVAAAGNAGPHAPAPYPAALPEVVGVTAVDGSLRIWRRATQGSHVDFAAPGVKVAVAGGEWTGTSLATPVVSGLLLRGESLEALSRAARDLGAPGRDPVFGFGFVSGF